MRKGEGGRESRTEGATLNDFGGVRSLIFVMGVEELSVRKQCDFSG